MVRFLLRAFFDGYVDRGHVCRLPTEAGDMSLCSGITSFSGYR